MFRTRSGLLFLLSASIFIMSLVVTAGPQRSAVFADAGSETIGMSSFVYLPAVMGGSGGVVPPPPPPPQSYEGSIFANIDWKTSSADIATDAHGGMHLVYSFYEPVDGSSPTYAVYLYCAADCAEGANWNGVAMGEAVSEVQLALTRSGKPRILFRQNAAGDGLHDFFYAACDSDCTDPAEWALTWVTGNRGMAVEEFNDDHLPQRYFALDPQDRPRFIYNDRDTWSEPDHLGTFYAFCNYNCTWSENWSETRISRDNGNIWNYRYEKFYYPSLTFTAQGAPRVVADGISMQDEFYLYYLACDTDCTDGSNWQRTALYERGSGVYVSYDLEVDAQSRPRVAFYEGARLGGEGDRLFYAWCNNGCLNSGSWQRYNLGLGWSDGRSPDLELDTMGRPRVAYVLYNVGGLGYSWCNGNCETAGAPWHHQVVESGADLLTTWPVDFPPHCDGGLWNGLAPTLSLDTAGNPRIGYDATYHARCWYNPDTGEWDPWSQMHQIWRTARVVFFAQP